jgi:putative ABC transport system substrate-binding protein
MSQLVGSRRAVLRIALFSVAASGLGALACEASAPPTPTGEPLKRTYRVVFLFTNRSQSGPQNSIASFKRAMTELGYTDGQNITYDTRDAAGQPSRFPALAAEIVGLKPDVIICQNTRAAEELIKVTQTVPIVIVSTASGVVEAGLVKDLAHPGGNLTGLTAVGPGVALKRLQLLKETAPAIKRIAVLQDAGEPGSDLAEVQKSAGGLGVEIVPIYLRSLSDVDGALASAADARVDAILMGSTTNFLGGTYATAPIAAFAMERRWPSAGPGVPVGVLLNYEVQIVDGFARAAQGYVDRIFRGAYPGDLPFEAATTPRLALNFCTASKIGVTVPQSVRLQVTEAYNQCP